MANPKITIADEELHKIRSASTEIEHPFGGAGSSSGVAGGIYHARAVSYGPLGRRSSLSRVSSADPRLQTGAEAEEGGDWNRDSGRKKQVFKGRTLLWYV